MYKILQNNIKHRLAQMDITVAELERRAGLKPSTVSNILLGRSKSPHLETVYATAKALGCMVDDLIHENNKPEPILDLLQIRLSKINWTPTLLIESIEFVQMYLTQHNLKVDSGNVIACILELYIYSSEGSGKFDNQFAIWYIEKAFKSI